MAGQAVPEPRNVLPSTAATRRMSAAGALQGLGADRVIEGIGVQALQGPPEREIARHHADDPCASRVADADGRFGDRSERAGAGQDRGCKRGGDVAVALGAAGAGGRCG